jgi:single-strand DNA-binding protein
VAGETQITLVGNLVDDPELRFTPQGHAVANFRVASTPRTFDRASGEWKDGEGMFLTCTVWRQYAENVAETLHKGDRVIVQGNLGQRSYETKEGEKRTVYEIDVLEVGPALRHATAAVTKNPRGNGGQQRHQSGGYGQNGGGRGGAPADDPWATNSGGGGGFGGGATSDQPPF